MSENPEMQIQIKKYVNLLTLKESLRILRSKYDDNVIFINCGSSNGEVKLKFIIECDSRLDKDKLIKLIQLFKMSEIPGLIELIIPNVPNDLIISWINGLINMIPFMLLYSELKELSSRFRQEQSVLDYHISKEGVMEGELIDNNFINTIH